MTEQFILPIALFLIGLVILIKSKKKFIVKIVNCSGKFWYKKEVFNYFIVQEEDKNTYLVLNCTCEGNKNCAFCRCDNFVPKYILKSDCKKA